MQTATRKTRKPRAGRNRERFTSPDFTIRIPKECLDAEMLQEMWCAVSSAASRFRECGYPAKTIRKLESLVAPLERLEEIVIGNRALHNGGIEPSEIPDELIPA